jgi:redox-sensitive bicupin YhaK (pirin superfamily)
MTETREVKTLLEGKSVVEGAGVYLRRAFGFNEVPLFDPFLLFDDFRSDNPDHYAMGFPSHPHRGIETITYVLGGEVEHVDSLGNQGTILAGDVQWMTAGSGIVHQEMPKGDDAGVLAGFQLWANLPAKDKMMPPRYQEIQSIDIPEIVRPNGVCIKLICGEVDGLRGPVRDIVITPEYLDVSMPSYTDFRHATRLGDTVFAYVFGGQACFCQKHQTLADDGSVVLFGDGDEICVSTQGSAARFLLISGKPLDEPVAWKGPIVMNSQEELTRAFKEYREGTFIKHA